MAELISVYVQNHLSAARGGIEALRDAVAAKAAGWDALAVAAVTDDRIDGDVIESWQARAADQTRRLIDLHTRVAEVAFGVASTDQRTTDTGPANDRSSS